jgi:hypothetical protein
MDNGFASLISQVLSGSDGLSAQTIDSWWMAICFGTSERVIARRHPPGQARLKVPSNNNLLEIPTVVQTTYYR